MAEINETASDAGFPDPGSPVADLSASQGINDDDLAMSTDHETIQMIEVPLEEDITNCEACLARNKRFGFLSVKEMNAHYREEHPQVVVKFRCRNCGRECPSLPSWNAHKGKCRGRPQGQRGDFPCTACDMIFLTKRGLSTHERHVHPVIRNGKRAEEANRPLGLPGRRMHVWSLEETNRLIRLSAQFRHEKNLNLFLQPYFPGKTAKQISDKRRILPEDRTPPVESDEHDNTEVEQEILEERGIMDSLVAEEVPGEQGTGEIDYNEAGEVRIRGEDGPTEEVACMAAVSQRETTIREDTEVSEWKEAMEKTINDINMPPDSGLARIDDMLIGIWRRLKDRPGELKAGLDEFIEKGLVTSLLGSEMAKGDQRGSHFKKRNPNRERSEKPNHTTRKRTNYARCQELFSNCPKRLADAAVSGVCDFMEFKQQRLPTEEVRALYEGLWGTKTPMTYKCETLPPMGLLSFKPITPEEVSSRIKKISAGSAAGLDLIKKAHLVKKDLSITLARLYNILLLTGHYPKLWLKNRTTLIPKAGKNDEDVKNWRPITVGSMLGRVFSGLVDKNIRARIAQDVRQKGFTSDDGCKHNTMILKEAIVRMKMGEGGVATVVDISKAFDTVPHEMIGSGLRRKGIPEHITGLVEDMYRGCTTEIKTVDELVCIELKRGVKQGDPLSPLLFNLAIEPIIERLSNQTLGIKVGNTRLAVLAFADDLIMIGKDRSEAQRQLRYLSEYLSSLGMGLAPEKCLAFQIRNRGKTWLIRDPGLEVSGSRIPYTEPDGVFGYLGTKYSPWCGLRKGTEVPIIEKAIRGLRRLCLKPWQKLEILETYLLPRYVYGLTASPPGQTTLRLLDRAIRNQVKDILHLASSTVTGFFYTAKLNGGLGLVKFENLVQLSQVKTSIGVQNSVDPVLGEVTQGNRYEESIRALAENAGIEWPPTAEAVDLAKRRKKRNEAEAWASSRTQGHGVKSFKGDKIGNMWLKNPSLMKSSRFIDAIRLRTNTFGTRVAMARANKRLITVCRRCGEHQETLGHILGQCVNTKPARIKRHDDIVDFLAGALSKRGTVIKEPTMTDNGELKKPDIVYHHDGIVKVLDVTVVYEKDNYLANAAKVKRDKYDGVAKQMMQRLSGRSCEVMPIVIGSRGTIPKDTRVALKALGFPVRDILTVSLMALRSSVDIACKFIDYNNKL